MNIFDLFFGKGNKFDLIFKTLADIEKKLTILSNENVAIQVHLDEIDSRLLAIQVQLDRIENAVIRKSHLATCNPSFGIAIKSHRRT